MWKQLKDKFENHALFGFNSNRFDVQVLERQFYSYGIQPPETLRAYDVRTWNHATTANHLNAEKGLKGNLAKIAVQGNVSIPEKLHRAAADVETWSQKRIRTTRLSFSVFFGGGRIKVGPCHDLAF